MKPKDGQRERCRYCQGYIRFHKDDPENPWKHDEPADTLRCARMRTASEKAEP